MRSLAFIMTAATLLIQGCVTYSPNNTMLGNNREQIIGALGSPSLELNTSDGTLMMYPRGPFGKHTYFVYLDENGQFTHWTQVLNEKNFDQIKPGMSRDEVVSRIGISKISNGIAFDRGYVWSWRYVNFHCSWFRIEFSADHIVRYTMYQKPPECRVKK